MLMVENIYGQGFAYSREVEEERLKIHHRSSFFYMRMGPALKCGQSRDVRRVLHVEAAAFDRS
jgi:hypothetical protein